MKKAAKKSSVKKTVHRITNEFDYNFILTGIICQQANFRLCRELNLSLDLKLTRKDDHVIFSQKRMEEQRFAMFDCFTPTEEQFILLSNKCKSALLLPEKPQFDFLLLVFPNALPIDENELLSNVKETKFVLGAYLLDPLKLKSKENLIF
jgi:hypothetical protein